MRSSVTITIKSNACGTNLFAALSSGEECYSDLTLIAAFDNTRIPVHRAILCTNNEYFRALLTMDMIESRQPEIIIQHVKGNILQSLIEFCYTGTIVVEPYETKELCIAASFFLFPELEFKLVETIALETNAANCIKQYLWAEQYNWSLLSEVAFDLILEHFSTKKVMRDKSFTNLTKDQLKSIISNVRLRVLYEKDVFTALLNWTCYDLKERAPFFLDLMKFIRIDQIDLEYITNDVACLETEIPNILYYIKQQQALTLSVEQPTRRIIPTVRRLCTLEITQQRNNRNNDILAMTNYKRGSWRPINSIEISKGSVRILTAGDGQVILQFDKGNIVMMLVTIPDFEITKIHHNVNNKGSMLLFFNNAIYVMGGHTQSVISLRCASRYDLESKTWTELKLMPSYRALGGSAVLLNRIYVVGGQENSDTYLNSVDYYSPESNTWTSVAPMNFRRAECEVCALQGHLYVLGGRFGNQLKMDAHIYSSIERYDPIANEWTLMSFTMQLRRYGFGLYVHNDWIYASGGKNYKREMYAVEKINPIGGVTISTNRISSVIKRIFSIRFYE